MTYSTMSTMKDATEVEAPAPAMSSSGVASVMPYVLTYSIAFILIFFVMGGYLPTPGTRVSSLQATSSSSDTIAGQLFQGFTWAFAIALMIPHTRQILDASLRMKAMAILPVLAIISCAWSQDPSTTLRRGVFLLLGTGLTFFLVRRFTIENLAQIVVVTGVIAGVLGILVSIALPQYGRDTFNGDAWQGIFRSKNGCAQIMLFFLSAAACFRFKSRAMESVRRLLYPVAGVLIIMSRAKTAWMLAPGLILLAAFLSGLRRFERRNVLVILLGVTGILVLSALAVPYVMPLILNLLGKDPAMSGRLPLWTAVIDSALKRPLLGYGYSAFWTGLRGESLNIYMTTHFEIYQAQNGLLEVWLELGLAGVVLVLFALFRAAKDALICLQYGHSQETNWFICLLALTVAYNVDETFLGSAHSLPWLMCTIACAGLADRVRFLRSGPMAHRTTPPDPFAMPQLRSIPERSFAGI
jgi:exopolysaccharide production protein ExoQ